MYVGKNASLDFKIFLKSLFLLFVKTIILFLNFLNHKISLVAITILSRKAMVRIYFSVYFEQIAEINDDATAKHA